nr:hypothetical protein [Tanacetum cinerariifolium]
MQTQTSNTLHNAIMEAGNKDRPPMLAPGVTPHQGGTTREGKKSHFKIIRTDGNSHNYLTFRTMFKNFNREYLDVLKSIVKERFKKTNLVDDMDNLLFQTLKTMFEPHV